MRSAGLTLVIHLIYCLLRTFLSQMPHVHFVSYIRFLTFGGNCSDLILFLWLVYFFPLSAWVHMHHLTILPLCLSRCFLEPYFLDLRVRNTFPIIMWSSPDSPLSLYFLSFFVKCHLLCVTRFMGFSLRKYVFDLLCNSSINKNVSIGTTMWMSIINMFPRNQFIYKRSREGDSFAPVNIC